MMPLNEKNYLLELLLKAYEGTLGPDETRILNDRINASDEAAELYAEFFYSIGSLTDLKGVSESIEMDEPAGFDTWINFLAKEERSAPAVELPEKEPEKVLVQKVIYDKVPHRVRSIYSAVFSAAAMLFIVLFIRFAPDHTGHEVVTLNDAMNAKWMGGEQTMQVGSRLRVSRSPLLLREGFAELLFDTNARIVLEAPAEFQILADDRIDLRYGKVYALIPREAIGFKINSPSAQVIDLGTEFGIEADLGGNTYLHMIKGKTTLIAGKEANKASMEVGAGTAKKVSIDTQTVADVPYRQTQFVRAFDAAKQVVWREQPSLDLADMVRNGNGLGTGNSSVRLDPVKGFTTDWHNGVAAGPRQYLSIAEHPFIDGIFVPDGDKPQIVSSRGDLFRECPDTSGLFDVDLFANPKAEILKTEYRQGTIRFDGRDYTEESGNACIVMHANRGLTFDLDAIRTNYHRGIDRFTCQIGIADFNENCPANADFYVLLDGKVCYSLKQYKEKGVLNDVSVEIKDTARFLSLVTTDGGDADYPEEGFYRRSISCDWCIFAEPTLELK
ncbi:MAG: NPCBM/NEW2 domain-containing protein [Planctomycetaceae bacterium]|nr:NPCBM/NEW2 domain-containing protein [Planctomycetaceae bacterium]